MKDYKSGSHALWDCKYHLMWITKCRYLVPTGDVGERARDLLRQISRSLDLTIYVGPINREHLHMLIGIPPRIYRCRERCNS